MSCGRDVWNQKLGKYADCTNEESEPHNCPYQTDIHGNEDEDYCSCCETCERECAVNI